MISIIITTTVTTTVMLTTICYSWYYAPRGASDDLHQRGVSLVPRARTPIGGGAQNGRLSKVHGLCSDADSGISELSEGISQTLGYRTLL